ncbi:glutamate-5-semialdehyde dehydrogenase [Glaciecola petra]|uniref:Gamma-glutamyl phosphate reductase n=1 Tax=Glaciecola petra TaxID=3075602 RepID=A0ABU2ZR45_9ALTE|nr:glutamate-5-semialdehyde dehydrogenase [Aestuariibacter sp. P117]MDT0595108.1 glutamate-5-semialdehyde dehydrogenase [Aestuariibacter sp. P117]
MSQDFNIVDAAKAAKAATSSIANLSQQARKNLLCKIANLLIQEKDKLLSANAIDLENAQKNALSASMLDRLAMTDDSIEQMANGVLEVASQEEVLGNINQLKKLPTGIQVGKMRIPLGVVAMIYESRPNVTIDAAVLCLKAGNAVVLRGGKEAQASNMALAKVIHDALNSLDLPTSIVTVIPDPDRKVMQRLLQLSQYIDLLIPRGGEGLIQYVTENSRIPVIQHFKGVCHLYVDKDADLDIAINLLENGKTQRTGVCNALETLLVHKDVVAAFLPKVNALFTQKQVKAHACEVTKGYIDGAELATEDDWHAEYLALEIAVKKVDDYDAAVAHIQAYGSGHTEVIVTEKLATSQQFIKQINSSVVMVNASSRFSDGGQLGLGAEIGISTSKLHAYGPMGAASLTTEKFVVLGNGQIRK